MNDDFNPFDLSAAPKPQPEEKPTAPPPPKPIIRRISMGPIFHSRITKVLATILGVVLAFLVGYTATSYYLTNKDSKSTSKTNQTTTLSGANTKTAETKTTATADKTAAASSNSGNAASPSVSSATPATTTSTPTSKVYCGVSGMPEGVCTAITDIEKNGLKGNSYVTADTSQVPAGSTVQVTESSWQATSDTTGTVSFTALAGGTTYNGVGTFTAADSVWKVTSYTLQ